MVVMKTIEAASETSEMKSNVQLEVFKSVEEIITDSALVSDALDEMKKYKTWSTNTFQSYGNDVQHYSSFCYNFQIEPILSNANLAVVSKWVKTQKEEGTAVATIERRLASLSSIYRFYKELGILTSNPFKLIDAPVGEKKHHSRDLELRELIEVHHCLKIMEEDGFDIEPTVRLMVTTGLRNGALTKLKVKDVKFEQQLLIYNVGIENYKHKVQVFPLPPVLLTLLKKHIHKNELQPDDTLLFGLKGEPLAAKQLNRITDKICSYLGWKDELRITPHGFRASIATLLHERDVPRDAIKFLLGHSTNRDNLDPYIRRNKKHLNRLRHELTLFEQEIEEGVKALKKEEGSTEKNEETSLYVSSSPSGIEPKKMSQQEFASLLKVNQELALSLLESNLISIQS